MNLDHMRPFWFEPDPEQVHICYQCGYNTENWDEGIAEYICVQCVNELTVDNDDAEEPEEVEEDTVG